MEIYHKYNSLKKSTKQVVDLKVLENEEINLSSKNEKYENNLDLNKKVSNESIYNFEFFRSKSQPNLELFHNSSEENYFEINKNIKNYVDQNINDEYIQNNKNDDKIDLTTNNDTESMKYNEIFNNLNLKDHDNNKNDFLKMNKRNSDEDDFIYSPNNKIFFEEFSKRMDNFIKMNINTIKKTTI